MTGRVLEERRGSALFITIENPAAMNAMTLAMWEDFAAVCTRARADVTLRAVVIGAAGERAFVSGTDINEFVHFDAQRGLQYERRMDEVFAEIEAIDVPTLAAINGTCAGGGLMIASACDLRFARKNVRFGVPIARSIGHTLSIASLRRAERSLGPGVAREMLLLARMIDAQRLVETGFLIETFDNIDGLKGAVDDAVDAIAELAPRTLRSLKIALRRLASGMSDDEDLIGAAYGSTDFREGVAAFLERRPARWTGT